MIPKIIHYCWLSNDKIPDDLAHYMQTWEKYLVGYKFMLWNFDRFPKSRSKWVSEAFDNKKYAFAADYIRLYAVYTYGGIYLDMDVEVLKSFDPLLQLNSMLCWQNEWPGLEVAAFGAEKGSDWIKDCLDFYNNRNFINDDGSFNTRPLPGVVEGILHQNGYTLIDVNNAEEAIRTESRPKTIPVLTPDYFSPKSLKTYKIKTTSNSFCIHHFAGSWLPWYSRWESSICHSIGIKDRAILMSIAKKLGIYK